MSAPRVCAKCGKDVPGFRSYQKGWVCEECKK